MACLQRLLGLVQLLQRHQRDAFVDGRLRQLRILLEGLGKRVGGALGKLLAHLRHAAIVQPNRFGGRSAFAAADVAPAATSNTNANVSFLPMVPICSGDAVVECPSSVRESPPRLRRRKNRLPITAVRVRNLYFACDSVPALYGLARISRAACSYTARAGSVRMSASGASSHTTGAAARRRIGVVTTSRADYSHLYWPLRSSPVTLPSI